MLLAYETREKTRKVGNSPDDLLPDAAHILRQQSTLCCVQSAKKQPPDYKQSVAVHACHSDLLWT